MKRMLKVKGKMWEEVKEVVAWSDEATGWLLKLCKITDLRISEFYDSATSVYHTLFSKSKYIHLRDQVIWTKYNKKNIDQKNHQY